MHVLLLDETDDGESLMIMMDADDDDRVDDGVDDKMFIMNH